MSDPVTFEKEGDVAVITMDDGKANALNPTMLTALGAALDRAREEAKAVVLSGREGRFCAGFDLKIMMQGPAAATGLVSTGAEVMVQLYLHPQPVVAACTGHAMAGGALLLLTSDVRIGAAGEFKIGLNEVSIGLPLPVFASELAHERLARRAFVASTLLAKVYDPESAADVGYLDRVVAPGELRATAVAEAARLGKLPDKAFASTKRSIRSPLVAHVRATHQEDLERVARDMGMG